MQSLHDKKCKSCGTKFVPKQPLQNCCTYDCFIENQNKKAKEKAQKREEKETLVDSIKRYKENPVILKSHDPKKFIKPIAHKSKTTKNTVRSLDDETIKEVYARDNYTCIIPDCSKRTLDLPHHAYFGGIQANRWPNRNEADQLVTVCTDCHYDIHFKGMQGKREFCIDYLKKHYAQDQN